ncbi:MAG: hypothetical protein Q8Q20_01105, partial [bacterium]|nr:hypothetical protein [bacterium]
ELSDIREISDLDERFEELTKKRGTLPVNLKNLYCLLRLKLEAQDTAIESIDTIHVSENGSVKARLVIKFLAMYTPRQIENLLRTNPGWVLGENQIKIDFDRLDPKKWFDDIDAVVKVFQTNKT